MFDFGRNDEIVPDPVPFRERHPHLRGDIAAVLLVLALMLIGGLLDG